MSKEQWAREIAEKMVDITDVPVFFSEDLEKAALAMYDKCEGERAKEPAMEVTTEDGLYELDDDMAHQFVQGLIDKCKQLQSDNERLQRELNALRPNPDHDAAMAAGDGTLHGAIDYWQGESDRLQKRVSELEMYTREIKRVTQEVMNNSGVREMVEELAEQALGESNE